MTDIVWATVTRISQYKSEWKLFDDESRTYICLEPNILEFLE